jgi:hypothetical protein
MNFSFYFLQYILGFFIESFYIGGMNWYLLLMFDIVALVCGAVSYVLYFWNKENKISNVLYALPVCGLGAELIGVTVFLINTRTYLFQIFFDFLGFGILGYLFYKKANSKVMYLMTVVIGTLTGYLLFYSSLI